MSNAKLKRRKMMPWVSRLGGLLFDAAIDYADDGKVDVVKLGWNALRREAKRQGINTRGMDRAAIERALGQ